MAAVRYTAVRTKTGGASIGTVCAIPKSKHYTGTGNTNQESARWLNKDGSTTYNAGSLSNHFYPGWLPCDGRTLNAADYPELWRIIGNEYGGNGAESSSGVFSGNFKLPDYRGKRLMGTGRSDGNLGSSGIVTPYLEPDGNEGGSPFLPGSIGGDYEAKASRFLPAGSEVSEVVTPPNRIGTPTGEKVWYYVTESFCTTRDTFVNCSLGSFGTGIGEYGFFEKPLFSDISSVNQYVRMHSLGTTKSSSRTYRLENVDLRDYNKLFVTAIAGNDANGGERPNDAGESLRVRFRDGSTYSSFETVIPSRGDSPLDGTDWDIAYSSWQDTVVDIPANMRSNNIDIEFNMTSSSPDELRPETEAVVGSASDLSDAYGIVRVGFLNTIDRSGTESDGSGNTFGGEADDTFTVGRFSTEGWEEIETYVDPTFQGTIEFNVGQSSNGTGETTLFGVPSHFHYISTAEVAGGLPLFTSLPGAFLDNEGRNAVHAENFGSAEPYNRTGRYLRSHSHSISLGTVLSTGRYGNDNSEGSTGYVNTVDAAGGGPHSQSITVDSDNVGNNLTKTIDVLNDMGVTANVAKIQMSTISRRKFDQALSVYLEAAEGVTFASTYTRVKYMIKAYNAQQNL